ncbi:MAG TPA: prolyl oligopeptidase family serine peptidase, partial [Thermoanaerobaculia bacterium]|nr:prolyl oligopeptidase family serine peptidase [Thermoanaerobaculia bacterium]
RLTLVTDRGATTQLGPAILDLATGALEPLAAAAAVPSAAATTAAPLEGPGATRGWSGDAVAGTGTETLLVSSSADGRIHLVADGAGALLLVDHREGVVCELMRLRPTVEVARWPQRRSLRYVARDGLSIPAELTLPATPAATAAASPGLLPAAVLLPPDDPSLAVRPSSAPGGSRQPLVELLADRGYVVLQPSPRGSAGFGPAFRAAGDRQWGGAMLDDLADGVRWLVSQGLADSERVAIVGFGWGGYAAVAALAFTPDLYAAGVSIDGPVDLEAMARRSEDPWRAAVLHRRVGDPDHFEQRQRLRRHSPLADAGAIRAPLLRIDLEEGAWSDPEGSARLIAVLRQLGRPVEVLAVGGSGGRLEGTAGALVGAEIERFLALHLGGPGSRPLRAESAPGDDSREAATTPTAQPVAAGAGP